MADRIDEQPKRCVIIGGGPAGLTAAYELHKLGVPAVVLEKDRTVGGLSRTATYKDYRFDIGGHRFFTKVPEVQAVWHEILGEAFLDRPRLSRIYYGDRFFDYPLKPVNALVGLGLIESFKIGSSYLKARLFRDTQNEERTFEQWVTNRFGSRLYQIFFKTYTEKVWGIPCSEMSAEWAAQRIKNLDLLTVVRNALLGTGAKNGEVVTTLIDRFHYPRFGPGMMWERCAARLAGVGYETRTGCEVTRIRHSDGLVRSLAIRDGQGKEHEEHGTHFVSSMPVRELVRALDPAPPTEVLDAAQHLRYRDFLTVLLIVDRAEIFPDNWIYIHSPDVKVGRIQNFKNWSPEMVPSADKTSLGLEYFVQEDDDLWSAADAELVELATRECVQLGFCTRRDVLEGHVVRMPKAYPVYAGAWKEGLATIRSYLETLPNLQLVGRNGQHRYNNQDHSMVTAMYAARNVAGSSYDIWDVNVDSVYHEAGPRPDSQWTDRAVPTRAATELDATLLREAFARFDPVALGGALSVVFGISLFLATSALILKGGERLGPNLSLLGNYLLGYTVSWGGALIGLVEGGLIGWAFGYLLARLINVVIRWHEEALIRRIELQSIDPLAGDSA